MDESLPETKSPQSFRRRISNVEAMLLTKDNLSEVAQWVISHGREAKALASLSGMGLIIEIRPRCTAAVLTGEYLVWVPSMGDEGEFHISSFALMNRLYEPVIDKVDLQ